MEGIGQAGKGKKEQKGRKMEEDEKERKLPKLVELIAQDWKQMHGRSDVIWADLESPSGLRGRGLSEDVSWTVRDRRDGRDRNER